MHIVFNQFNIFLLLINHLHIIFEYLKGYQLHTYFNGDNTLARRLIFTSLIILHIIYIYYNDFFLLLSYKVD